MKSPTSPNRRGFSHICRQQSLSNSRWRSRWSCIYTVIMLVDMKDDWPSERGVQVTDSCCLAFWFDYRFRLLLWLTGFKTWVGNEKTYESPGCNILPSAVPARSTEFIEVAFRSQVPVSFSSPISCMLPWIEERWGNSSQDERNEDEDSERLLSFETNFLVLFFLPKQYATDLTLQHDE